MLINTAAKAPPVFLSDNYLTRFAERAGDLVVSSGTALRKRLYAVDAASKWRGDNADDGVDETITFGHWLPGFQTQRDIDFIAFLGHNLASFDVKLSANNGASYAAASYAVVGHAASYYIKNVANAVSADKTQIVAHTTQTEDDYKEIGGVVVASVQLQSPMPMSSFRRLPFRVKDKTAEMHDGSRRGSFVSHFPGRIYFNDFSVGIGYLSESEADALQAILLGRDPFIFYPRPGDWPGKMYRGRAVPGTVTRNFMDLSTSGGEVIYFDFEELGGA